MRYGGQDEAPVDPAEFGPERGGAFLVAFADGVAVGYVRLRRHDEAIAEVKRMYVRPTHRRRGLGRVLLRSVETRARALGYARLSTRDRHPAAGGDRPLHRRRLPTTEGIRPLRRPRGQPCLRQGPVTPAGTQVQGPAGTPGNGAIRCRNDGTAIQGTPFPAWVPHEVAYNAQWTVVARAEVFLCIPVDDCAHNFDDRTSMVFISGDRYHASHAGAHGCTVSGHHDSIAHPPPLLNNSKVDKSGVLVTEPRADTSRFNAPCTSRRSNSVIRLPSAAVATPDQRQSTP